MNESAAPRPAPRRYTSDRGLDRLVFLTLLLGRFRCSRSVSMSEDGGYGSVVFAAETARADRYRDGSRRRRRVPLGDRPPQWGSASILGLLAAHGLPVVNIPGHTVHHAAKAYRGDGKTDAKDAAIIADQARMRRDLQLLSVADETRIELRALTAHRKDLVCDRTRAINRLRGHLLEYFPALERAFNYSASRASLLLLTGYATPDAIRKMGESRLARWLRALGCQTAVATAATAVAAAKSQQSVLPGQAIAAELARRLAPDVIALESRIAEIDQLIAAPVETSRAAELMRSMPGFGPLLAAEFLASTGADLSAQPATTPPSLAA